MSPPRIIQHQRYKKYSSIPPSGPPRASSPTILNLQQTPSTGEQCSPLHLIRASSCRRKIAPLFADFTLCWRIVKRCRVHHSDSTFIENKIRNSSFTTLHRLVGLRLLRLCLKLRQGFALYPQWVSPLDPDQGRVPGPFARFARCFILLYACNLLWSAMLIPHSSFLISHFSLLIPHSSLLT